MVQHVASVLGLAFDSPLTRFTVRLGPGTSFNKAGFMAQKDTRNLLVLDIKPDVNDAKSDFGRVYQWFELEFPNGETGWLRGHVVGIQGDFNDYGYGFITEEMHAYLLERDPNRTGPIIEDTPSNTVDVPIDDDDDDDDEGMSLFKAALLDGTATISGPENATTATPVGGNTGTGTAVDVDATPIETTPETAIPATAIIKTKDAAYVRNGPSTVGFSRIFTVPRLAPVPILDVQEEKFGQHYDWYKISYQGKEGWIRADLVRYEGSTAGFDLPEDLYPAPMRDNSWWVRGYNRTPHMNTATWEHRGWDLGANTGEAIFCGPKGGVVVQVLDCSKCTPDRPNTLSQGIRLGDFRVYSDVGWGFGYGTFVVIGYHHQVLPESTRKMLRGKGFSGASLYALYAHLQRRVVNHGDTLQPNTIIGFAGNTGNSEATHLHLEVRIGKSATYPGWSTLGSRNLVNPSVLFNR